MIGAGFQPDLVIYTTLLSLYTKKEDTVKSEEVFNRMIGAGFQPNLVTYTTLLSLYTKKEDSVKSEDVYNRMIGAGFQPNLVTSTQPCHLHHTSLSLHQKRRHREIRRGVQ
eukprot:TRINITY_DN15387_c0_g1_i6.p1 TRINITY_DN15387_c0_g1~~TRINITY_DN15387_c0_g1_i6.p1  ORF type:complete len:111 (-),score=30.90 TRINITY_DN15387_c0_g1_i6:37-369(-)